MQLNSIKDGDVVYFGERVEPYFASSIIIRGMLDKKNLKTNLGWSNGVRWLQLNDYFFIYKKDSDAAKIDLRKKFKRNKAYVRALIKKCVASGNKLIGTSKKIETAAKLPLLNRARLAILLKKYAAASGKYMVFQNIALFEEPIAELSMELAEKYSDEKNQTEEILSIITSPSNQTASEHEQDDFLRLCVKGKNEGDAAKHAQKYGWLALRFFVGQPWAKEEVLQRLGFLDPKTAEKKLLERISHRKEREKDTAKLTKTFSSADKASVHLIRQAVFLRTQRTDFFQHSSFFVQEMMKKIAFELEVSYSDLLFLSAEEILLSLEKKFDYLACINKRKKGFLVFFDFNENKVLEGKAFFDFVMQRPFLKMDSESVSEFSGKTGFPGVVIGPVKIVKSTSDVAKVKTGDILVSFMTTANFTPAMEKAAAFVTDEGGITCHAAIIARELKKPCIIGTKIATKVLKDNDIVKVDAENGIVQILKKG